MPRGDKSKYTAKQKRQAEHIEKSYIERGVSKKTAVARAWATVNEQDGGGKLPGGSGRATTTRRKKASRRNHGPSGSRASTGPSRRMQDAGRDTASTTRTSPRSKGRHKQPEVYRPSKAEIKRRCREIQATWTPATRRLREVCKIDPLVLTPVHIEFSSDGLDNVA